MSDAEFQDWQRSGLGGSTIAAVLGLSPWGSPYSAWAFLVGLVPGQEQNARMEFGLRAEPMLAKWFTDKTGLEVIGEQSRVTHPDKPWMRCTLDGMVAKREVVAGADVAVTLGVAEWKTTSEPTWEKVPDYYACQATWNMIVTGTRKCWFGVLHLAFGRPDFQVYEFDLHDGDAEFITAAAEAFWHDHVLTGNPPDVDAHEATTDALSGMWPDATGSIEADDRTRKALAELREWDATLKTVNGEIDRLKNELRLAIGDGDTLTIDGQKAASWKWQEANRIDLDALRAEQPDIANTYTIPSRSRVLRITKEKQ